MTEPQATAKADSVLKFLLENCPAVVGSGTMLGDESPERLALSIAKFRQTLITAFLKQPL